MTTQNISKPDSVCTIATKGGSYYDLELLIHSLNIFEKNITIYILCDTYVEKNVEKIKDKYSNINFILINGLEKYSGKNRIQMEREHIWLEFMLEKCTVIDNALKYHTDTLFLDSDIIITGELPNIDKRKDIGLSQHTMMNHLEEKYGKYNGGYIWVNNKNFTTWWRKKSTETNEFYEQKCLEYASKEYCIMEFPIQNNFGWWRCFYTEDSNKRINSFSLNENGMITYEKLDLRSVHTHLYDAPFPEVVKFNTVILNKLRDSRNANIVRLNTFIQSYILKRLEYAATL